jgi:hypothetical protein
MKRIFFVAAMLLLSCQLFAQQGGQRNGAAALPPPIAKRDIHGRVQDSKGETIIGAKVVLSSKLDTFMTATNADGIFIFHGVKSADFYLNVSYQGYTTRVVHNRVSDTKKDVTLDPVELKEESKELSTVTINGTPSITYKIDTVEYKASDYKVRENSTVDELLKHMEGFEVGSDGSVTHQGQAVTKARLNGRDYAGGNLAQAIQSLPADIVDKIQVVDDYGDQAARTGIKDGDPTKVLNITTQANKSVGNILRLTASPGDNDRYNYNVFYNRINANQVITLNATTSSVVPGVVNSGAGSGQGSIQNSNTGTAGTIVRSSINTSYRDQVSKTTQINGSYTYSYQNTNTTSASNGAQYNTITDPITNQKQNVTSIDTATGASKTMNYSHSFTFDYEFQPDSQNYLRIRPNYTYSYSYGSNSQITNSVGYENQFTNNNIVTSSVAPSYGVVATYQFLAKHDHRQNISLSYTNSTSTNNQTIGQNEVIIYRGTNGNTTQPINRSTTNDQTTKNNTLQLQYAQPLSKPAARVQQYLEFNEQYTSRNYDVNKIQSNVNQSTGALSPVDTLSNIYKYSFTQQNYAFQYRRNGAKSQLTIGVRALLTNLDGTNISKNTTTNHNDFYFLPVFRYQYQWTRTEQISVNYNGSAQEPSFAQIQPVPDYSNNFLNPIYGNPNLNPSFTHTLTTRFQDYIANSKFNVALNSSTSITQDQIVSNDILTSLTLPSGAKQIIDQTHYLNASGAKSETLSGNLAKQLDNRAYNLELNVTANWAINPVYSDNVAYSQTYWHFNERFGPIITPNTTLEFRPYVSYDIARNFSTLPSTNPNAPNSSQILTTQLDLTGRVFLGADKRFTFQYDVSKNYISGIAGFNKNPFVANGYVEYEFFQRKNGILRFSGYDIFKQAVFLNHNVSPTGYTNTLSNTLSRYFTLSAIWNFQKFSGTPSRNGRPMMRRGDGSFIVE